MRRNILGFVVVGALFACGGRDADQVPSPGQALTAEEFGQMELWKMELMKADWASNEALQQKGPSSWSTAFAPEGSVIRAGVGEVRGLEAVHDDFMERIYSGTLAALQWSPQRAEVSRSGDLGYTVGEYEASGVDSVGTRTSVSGMYVRMWTRQPDDTWKVELEIQKPLAPPEVLSGGAPGDVPHR